MVYSRKGYCPTNKEIIGLGCFEIVGLKEKALNGNFIEWETSNKTCLSLKNLTCLLAAKIVFLARETTTHTFKQQCFTSIGFYMSRQ